MGGPPAFPFLFVIGCPRSGTSLLTSILSRELAIPYETHFIPLFERVLWLWGDLRRPSRRAHLLRSIYEFLEIWTVQAARGRALDQLHRLSLLATKPSADELVGGTTSYPELVEAIYRCYARGQDHERPADKSAFYSHVPLESLDRSVSNARFLHIVRDGRDVCLSWRREPYGPSTVAEAAREWARHITEKEVWGQRNPDRYLRVLYEELITEPGPTLRRIAAFVGIPYSDELQHFHGSELAAVWASGEAHPLMAEPIVRENREKWRKEMSAADIAAFDFEAGATLRRYGYAMADTDAIPVSRFGLRLRSLWSRLRAQLSGRWVRLELKSMLPVVVWLTTLVGIPLSRLLNQNTTARSDAVTRAP